MDSSTDGLVTFGNTDEHVHDTIEMRLGGRQDIRDRIMTPFATEDDAKRLTQHQGVTFASSTAEEVAPVHK